GASRNLQAAQKGPDARRRPRAARKPYCLYGERAAEGANEADGPFSAACLLHLGERARELLESQELALGVRQVRDAQTVLVPARVDLALELHGNGVDGRITTIAPRRIGLELPVPGGVDQHTRPLARAVLQRVGFRARGGGIEHGAEGRAEGQELAL